MGVIAVRAMQAADRDAVISIHKQSIYGICKDCYTEREMKAWTARLTPELFDEGMKDENNIGVVAIDGSAVIANGFFSVKEQELRALYVLPHYTNKGAGRLIMERLEETAREKRLKKLALQSTLNAVSFYRSLGYREIKTERHAVSEDVSVTCVRMEKELQ